MLEPQLGEVLADNLTEILFLLNLLSREYIRVFCSLKLSMPMNVGIQPFIYRCLLYLLPL